MNDKKKSFILYADQENIIDILSDEQAGKIFKTIYSYVNRQEIPQLDREQLIAFTMLKNQIDRDTEHWNEIRERRANAGRKHSGNQFSNGTNGTNVPNVPNSEQNGTNGTVNVNENVNVNVNVNENENENVNKENSLSSSLSQPQENYSKEIYKLWTDAKLPIEKDIFQFQCGGFKTALSSLKGLHSDDVIKASKNYIHELKKKTSFITNKYRFERFVQISQFKDFLPGFYDTNNFKKFGENPQILSDTVNPWETEGMSANEFYHVKTPADLLKEKAAANQ